MSTPVLRPAAATDLDAILALAHTSGAGLTTLPADASYIGERLERSLQAFAGTPRRPGAEQYLFVVEDADEIVGCSAVVARVGGFDPFYTFEIRPEPVSHAPLGIDRSLDVLHVKRDHKGPTELCGLVIAQAHRSRGIGRLASHGRLLFIAAFPERFAERTISEIRGVQDDDGRSPFWSAVASVFFSPHTFAEIDVMSGRGEKDVIADLMPTHPIYLDLLPADARAAIGCPHRDATGAVRLLQAQGFTPSTEVDILDAGPIMECPTDRIGAVQGARRVAVGRARGESSMSQCLVARVEPTFRAVATIATVGDGAVLLNEATASALQVAPGDEVVVVVEGDER